MQGPNTYASVFVIPFGAGPGTPRIVLDGVNGSIEVYSATGLAMSITSNPVALLVYQPS